VKKHKQKKRKTTKHQAAKRKQRKSSVGSRPPVREWVGGRFLAPFHVDEETRYRPVFEVWVELPLELVVHFEIHNPNEPIPALADGLRDKLFETAAALRPTRLRLDDRDWAADVRRMLPMLKVVAGPTPELEPVLDHLVASMEEDAPAATYLDDGSLSAAAMGSLFEAAAALFHLAPWKSIGDAPLIEMKIPELDVHRACISVIGTLGESFGFLLFESFEATEALFEVAEALEEGLEVEDLGAAVTSLNFERGADLPPSMRREAQQHGWPVAAAKAYPVVEHRDSSGFPRSVTPHELRIMTACTEVLVSVFEKHGSRFAADETPEFTETHVDSQGHEVLVKVPPDGWMTDDELPAVDSMGVFEMDNALLAALLTYATDRWDDRIPQRIDRLLREPHEESIAIHFGLYQLIVEDGKTVAQCFLEDNASTLHERARRWLEALWTLASVWNCTTCSPERFGG
jgi:hypothetical protein